MNFTAVCMIDGVEFQIEQIASLEVDPMNCFTPLCAGELPVPGGHLIVPELNAQAKLAGIRTFSKDAHPMNAYWITKPGCPQLSKISGNPINMDVHWNVHGVPGTFGFELISGLPPVDEYDFRVYKGLERGEHPYGACYHDAENQISTGLIEWYYHRGIKVVIVGGLATDYCVSLTVMQLIDAGFCIFVNLGACRGIDRKTTKAAIKKMKMAGAIIVNNAAEIKDNYFCDK